MTRFAMDRAPTLSRSTVNRDEPLRDDTRRQAAMWPRARVLPVDETGRAPVVGGASSPRLDLRPAVDYGAAPVDAVLLGEQDGVAYWAVPALEPPSEAGDSWQSLRDCGGELDATDAGLLTTAVALLAWHARAGFCTLDGSPTEPRRAGWVRRCTRCGHEEYPRTDPAVICLIHDPDDTQVLLARQQVWPVGRYSILAGFVEAGESLESCVAREIGEEVGVDIRELRYLGSQPWPFPRSLMLGFAAVADPDEPLHPADGEIADARWVSREVLQRALARGDWTDPSKPPRRSDDGGDVNGSDEPEDHADPVLLPGLVSIARGMLEAWAAAPP